MRFPVLKQALSRVGTLVPPKAIHFASGFLNYLAVGRWFRDRGLEIPVRCADRELLYRHLATIAREPASYLEFGVFNGSSLRCWTGLLQQPETRFDGFDSFIGLPESWNLVMDKKVFDLGGKVPRFDDPRVRLHQGWFSETLPDFVRQFKPQPNLIVHLDADLYSSTAYVLRALRPFLGVGAILIFDEFFDREHELKAFTEFLDEERFPIKCLGATSALTQAAFQITGLPSGPAPGGKISPAKTGGG